VKFAANAGESLEAADEQRTVRRREVHGELGARLPPDVGATREGRTGGPHHGRGGTLQLIACLRTLAQQLNDTARSCRNGGDVGHRGPKKMPRISQGSAAMCV